MPGEATRFQYKPLDHATDSIRLIEILPGLNEDVIRCKMRHTKISDSSYTSLSYTWEPQFPRRDIEVNGKLLSVGQNLYRFLHAYRAYPTLERAKELKHLQYGQTLAPSLWIDAICICQSDNTEKSHQVQQMGTIYRDARHVLIWLGRLKDYYLHLFRDLNYAYDSRLPVFAMGEKEELKERLTAFYSLPYWSRVWVVQEILVACGTSDRKLAIFSGRHLMDFDRLFNVISRTATKIGRSALILLTNSSYQKFGRHSVFRTTPQGDFAVPSPLKDLLLAFRQDCTDKRDRIFALLSVSSDVSSMNVNYQLNEEQLFRYVLEQYIAQSTLDESLKLGAILIEALELGGSPGFHIPAHKLDRYDVSSRQNKEGVGVGKPTWTLGQLSFAKRSKVTMLELDCMFVPIFDNCYGHIFEYAVENHSERTRVRYARLHEFVQGLPNVKRMVFSHERNESELTISNIQWIESASDNVYYYRLGHSRNNPCGCWNGTPAFMSDLLMFQAVNIESVFNPCVYRRVSGVRQTLIVSIYTALLSSAFSRSAHIPLLKFHLR